MSTATGEMGYRRVVTGRAGGSGGPTGAASRRSVPGVTGTSGVTPGSTVALAGRGGTGGTPKPAVVGNASVSATATPTRSAGPRTTSGRVAAT